MKYQFLKKKHKGMGLLELLFVVIVVFLLATMIIVTLDPVKRLLQGRNIKRGEDVVSVISAIRLYQLDNNGSLPGAISSITDDYIHMIGTHIDPVQCTQYMSVCDTHTPYTSTLLPETGCIDLNGLVTSGYLPVVPISSDVGFFTSESAGGPVIPFSAEYIGYTIQKNNSVITIRACLAEGEPEIIEIFDTRYY